MPTLPEYLIVQFLLGSSVSCIHFFCPCTPSFPTHRIQIACLSIGSIHYSFLVNSPRKNYTEKTRAPNRLQSATFFLSGNTATVDAGWKFYKFTIKETCAFWACVFMRYLLWLDVQTQNIVQNSFSGSTFKNSIIKKKKKKRITVFIPTNT